MDHRVTAIDVQGGDEPHPEGMLALLAAFALRCWLGG